MVSHSPLVMSQSNLRDSTIPKGGGLILESYHELLVSEKTPMLDDSDTNQDSVSTPLLLSTGMSPMKKAHSTMHY